MIQKVQKKFYLNSSIQKKKNFNHPEQLFDWPNTEILVTQIKMKEFMLLIIINPAF